MQMKKLLLAGIAAALCSTPAAAAPPPIFNWSGFYVGVNAGGMWSKADGHYVSPPGGFATGSVNAFTGGVHAGLQRQYGNVVVGAEVSYSTTFDSKFGSTTGGGLVIGDACDLLAIEACQARIVDTFQAGGRLGWAQGPWLLYGTGGWANGLIQSRELILATGATFDSTSERHNGWFAGGGLEFAVARNATVGVEYLHFDLGSELHNTPIPSGNRVLDGKADVVRVRFTLMFEPPFSSAH
jgi:outer membrane immunogenic protein